MNGAYVGPARLTRPNIIVIVTDDQGYGDLSCAGSEFVTPGLDRLAAEGVRLTGWYANSPVCSPSRAALLTGCYPARAGVRRILPAARTTTGLPPGRLTLPSALSDLGYRTALIGKWHLGVAPGWRPADRGFDEWFGFLGGCVDYFSHLHYYERGNPVHDLWDNGKEVFMNGEYLTDLLTDRALSFVADAAKSSEPFFLYVCYNAPHYPMHAPRKYVDRFRRLTLDRRIMAAMLAAADEGIGRILDELSARGLRDDTCVFFMSDNGPSRESRNWMDGRTDPYYGGSAGSFRGQKGSLFEGGIRVPAILSWPARLRAGMVVEQPYMAVDILPTLLAAAGGTVKDGEVDGVDILDAVAEGRPAHDQMFWEMDGQLAILRNGWKLVLHGRTIEKPDLEQVFLSNLLEDAGERHNLAARAPKERAELIDALLEWSEGQERHWRETMTGTQWGPGTDRKG